MSNVDLLIWSKGAGLHLALFIFFAASIGRLFEVFSLGRRTDCSVARARTAGSGRRSIFSRFALPRGLLLRPPFVYLAGYVFHLALFAVLFFYVPHIAVFHGLLGISWPGIPGNLVNVLTLVALAALAALLLSRILNPVRRLISRPGDYLAWLLSFLPLITGYLALNHLFADYTLMLSLHLLSAELLLALLPFTRLFHAISLFPARWYSGEYYGRRGVVL